MDKKERKQFVKEIDKQTTLLYNKLDKAWKGLDDARDEMRFLLSILEIATEIILGEWPEKQEGDDIHGIQSGKNYGNTGYSGGCTQPS